MTSKVVPILKNSIGPVESNVPAPTLTNRQAKAKYPFLTMKVGQSFTVPKEMEKRIYTAASSCSRRHPPLKFTGRVEGDRIRIWRIK